MNESNIEKGKKAYYSYIEKNAEIETDIVKYISERIEVNNDTISNLIKETKEEIDMDKLEKIFQKNSKYKRNKNIKMNEYGFIEGTLVTQKGVLLIEENKVEKVIESYIDAILSRNAIVIADIDYSEISVKKLILEIIKEALKKFDVNENLIQILPYEEVNDEEFNQYKVNDNTYVYLENEEFFDEVKNKEKIMRGELYEVIDEINKEGICKCAIIYTKDKDKAYKFINLVNGENVFVNATEENIKEASIDDFYIHKNVIYPTR